MKLTIAPLLFILFISFLPAQSLYTSEPNVRVSIINSLDTLNIQLNGNWSLQVNEDLSLPFSDSSKLQIIKNSFNLTIPSLANFFPLGFKQLTFFSIEDTATMSIADVPYGVGWWWGGSEDRSYSGTVHIYQNDQKNISVVVHLPLEQYLKGVVPYEIGGDSPMEALKAQAVAARSEAVIALKSGLYGGDHHDLTSDVECQVFSGNHKRTPSSDQAVDETRGLVISEDGQAIHAFYASNCGGRSELIQNVWPSRNPSESYQVSLPDNHSRRGWKLTNNWRAKRWIKSSPIVYCNPEYQSVLPSWSKKNFRWSRSFSTEEITDMVSNSKELGNLKKIKILKRGNSGRIIQIKFIFEHGSFESKGELRIRQLFEPSLRSSNFYVKKTGDTFTLHGAGWGHGVGMCQSGAIAQASHGLTFESILKHYYSASELLDIYSHE